MTQYLLIFVILLVCSVGLYALYQRYFRPVGRSDRALYVEALQDLLDGKEETAFGKLRQVVAEDSDNVDAYMRLGRILRDHNKPDRALQVHKDLTVRADLRRDQKVAILCELASDYLVLGEFDMAQAALRELISIDPQNRWAYRNLLELQKGGRRWDEAYDTAAQILRIESGKSKKPLAAFKYQMGQELYRKREYHKARVLFKEALGLDPKYAPAYLAMGDSYNEEERYEDAVNFWSKLIEAVPSEAHQVIERLKKTLFDLGRFGDIADICERILKHLPKDHQARLTLAEFHEKKGDLDLAEEVLLHVVDDEPENLEAILQLIGIYLEKGSNKKIEELSKSLELRREKRQSASGNGTIDTTLIGIG